MVEKVGSGQFGQVVKAWDRVRKCTVAVKIIKNKKVFLDQAQHEISILTTLQKYVKSGESVIGKSCNPCHPLLYLHIFSEILHSFHFPQSSLLDFRAIIIQLV